MVCIFKIVRVGNFPFRVLGIPDFPEKRTTESHTSAPDLHLSDDDVLRDINTVTPG